jgi:hypothetical protein
MGIGYIGPIKPTSILLSNWYTLVAIDYGTKWVETRTFHPNTIIVITKFLYEHIFTRFGCP